MKFKALVVCAALGIAACGNQDAAAVSEKKVAPTVDAGALLDAAIAGSQRSDEEKARDNWRHPKETLQFFGVEPGMAVVEVWPGGGWYSNILAPYLNSGGGVYIAAHVDPAASERAAAAVERFRETFSNKAIYGDVRITALGAGEIAEPGSVDVVLTFRNIHNWMSGGTADDNFKTFFAALKPGGVLGVVEHRADEGQDERDGTTGYVKVSTVKELAEAAGYIFAGASEINANPADTKDHPFGVWTLPPVRRSAASAGQEDPSFDRNKYDAIGESDRMTLKFVKPAS